MMFPASPAGTCQISFVLGSNVASAAADVPRLNSVVALDPLRTTRAVRVSVAPLVTVAPLCVTNDAPLCTVATHPDANST